MRKIPATMATQHPDNANAPYWNETPFISTLDEVEECYRVFSDLGCDEYMWDWEGKFVDEAVVERLFNRHEEYFRKHQVGRDKFLTFRVPNIWKEKGYRLARSYMTIITASHTAAEHGMHAAPIFEVILPMTTEAKQLITILEKYRNALKYEQAIFEERVAGDGALEMIPLIEGSATLLHSRKILKDYVARYQKIWKRKVAYLRPFIARSDPALDAGFLPAVLSARGAISEYYRFEEESGVPVYPIIGVGCPLFRGGLSPTTLDSFLENYAGVRTVTLQSAFRYDYPAAQVKRAIETLNKELPRRRPARFSERDIQEVLGFSEHFAASYRPVVTGLARTINDLARFIPSHRERIPHTGHFGYSRRLGKQTHLPRAISFVATLASLGIPPSVIGTGRGLKELFKDKSAEKRLLRYLPTLTEDLARIGAYLNWENLKFLIKKDAAWEPVREDVLFLEKFIGRRMGPQTSEEFIHRNLTSNIYHYWRGGKKPELRDAILQAARARRSLG
jgi:phosphoenolpyruvate carboxylase